MKYTVVIREQETLGIIERVEDPESSTGGRIHYLPHHAIVKNNNMTTKVRVVFDASVKSNGPSLNECLHIGPRFNQKILDILLKFRVHKVALTGDIEKAFLMVSVEEKDRDVLRFLWTDDIEKEPTNYQVYRFTRVVFGVAASPFLLNATIRHHLEKSREEAPSVIDTLIGSIYMYVDDVVTGASNTEHGYQLYLEAKEVLRKGGFNLRKFHSNDKDLQAMIDAREGTPQSEEVDSSTYTATTLGKAQKSMPGEQKVLGVRWKIDSDEFILDLETVAHIAQHVLPTKRNVISTIGRIYDPLGILTPVVIPFKVFFQELCSTKHSWDAPLPPALSHKWHSLVKGLLCPRPILIPRCFIAESHSGYSPTYRICGFGDASSKAYAAVAYLLIRDQQQCHCRIICSKTRVAPMNNLTIPRLELLSALLVARLVKAISNSLAETITLQNPVCFLDSKVAYHWICGKEKSWRPFIQNRVNEIRRLIPTPYWRHCPGTSNPADWPSRGQTLSDFADNSQWFSGPEWLLSMDVDSEANPNKGHEVVPAECLSELKKEQATSAFLSSDVVGGNVSNIIEIQRFSDVDKLFRVTGYVLLFTQNLRSPTNRPSQMCITTEWIEKAEILWMKAVQERLGSQSPTWKAQLGCFIDDKGLVRCKGRLKNAPLPYSTRFPLLIPREHYLSVLLIRRAHEQVFHNGVKETLTQLRAQYWIPKGRSHVKQAIRKCVLCRRMEGTSYAPPPPPPLPSYQVEEVPSFTFTGVDFAGPLMVRIDKTAPCTSKTWICLYTCCTTRAVHLEAVLDMTTQSFIRSFKRFTSR